MKTLYTAHVTSIAGRNGHAETDDGNLSVNLSMPGSNKSGTTNPEQLFACGYAACFGGAVEGVAKKGGHSVGEVKVASEVSLNENEGGWFISAGLDVSIAGVDQAIAEEIVTKAHAACPYSKATRGNIEVTLKVNGTPLQA